jgi:PEP-CTERM putative exosortase interaction domain
MKTQLISLAFMAAFGVTAQADPIYIDYGANNDLDANTTTDVFTQLGFGQLKATSIYTDSNANGILEGNDAIYDTNIQSILQSYFATGTYNAKDGTPNAVSLDNTIQSGNASITALLPLVGFLNSIEGFNTNWNMTLQYEMTGTYAGLLAGTPFTSGYLNLFYNTDNNPGNEQLLLTMSINNSLLTVGNLNIFGTITYVGNGPNGNSNFFNFAPIPGPSFSSLLGQNVSWLLDTNIDPPIPTDATLANIGNNTYARQTQLDGSIRFSVPEPGTLSLLGLGLLGFALRFKKQAA